MLVNCEKRYFENGIKVWKRAYTDLQNMIHWHKECELIYIKKGSAEISVNHNCFKAKSGDLIVCKGGDMHRINSIEKGTVCDIIIFDDEFLRPIINNNSFAHPHIDAKQLYEKNINASDLFSAVGKELRQNDAYTYEAIKSYITTFIIKCIRNLKLQVEAQNNKNHKKKFVDNYQKLLQYIDDNYASVDFKTSAKLMNFTPQYFSKIFKEISGLTFTEYLNNVKIEKAINLIQTTDLTIASIAEKCGFMNIRSFNRTFKKITGKTPTEINNSYQILKNLHPTIKNHDLFDATISYTSIEEY